MPKALRTAKLVIDLPVPGAEPFIMAIVQSISIDAENSVTQVVPRQREMHRRASSIIMDMVTFTDPVTQHECTISGAGLNEAITAMVSKWIIEDCERDGVTAALNENGRIVIEE